MEIAPEQTHEKASWNSFCLKIALFHLVLMEYHVLWCFLSTCWQRSGLGTACRRWQLLSFGMEFSLFLSPELISCTGVQGSTNCSILPSWMGKHGLRWENMENIDNIEKMENNNLMTYKWFKQSFWPPEDSKHFILRFLCRWSKKTYALGKH